MLEEEEDIFAETIEEVAPPPPNGFSPEIKLSRREQLPLAEHESDLGLPQSIQPQEEVEEEDEEEEKRREAYEEEHKDSFKRVLKSVQAHSHPDIRCKPNRKFPHPDSADFNQEMEKLQERVALLHGENQCKGGSEDSGTDSDEEICIPTKKYWLSICLSIWGMEDDAAVRSQVKATDQVFEIYTDGLYNENGDSGCGAILHDFPHRPIAARSKVIPKGKCVSPFHLQLEGVALGVKLAMQYDAFPFYLYCPSESVCYFVDQNWLRIDECRCSGVWETVKRRCKVCSKRLMFTRNHEDHEVAFELTEDIFSDISELEKRGLPWFSTCDGRNENNEKNEVAYYLASLLQDKEYKLKEIGERKELWDIIYREASGFE
ncbi:hypothetical protein MKX03_020723 [Papaver bracteatum]|nr:hypothetical protein MKX03_020723 [Papaver bracteatum]